MQYSGNCLSDTWKYLDGVEQIYQETPAQTQESLNEVGDVYDVMEAIVLTPDGAKNLVERYSQTPSRHIWVYLAGTIGTVVINSLDEEPQVMHKIDERLRLYFKLFKDVRWLVISPDMLMGMLGVINRIVESGFWDKQKVPEILYDVLQRSLTFGWGVQVKADYVRLAAIDLLSKMCETGLIERDFTPSEREWLYQQVVRFANEQQASGSVQEEAFAVTAKFFACLNKKTTNTSENLEPRLPHR